MRQAMRAFLAYQGRPDTSEDVRWRTADSKARELAEAERRVRFPKITNENFADAVDFFEERTRYHRSALLSFNVGASA